MKSAFVLALCVSAAVAGVFPNYGGQFEFKSLDVQKAEADFPDKDWWETASFYQIYPRSFKDSDGDGVGDLKGITQNLAYLKEIGITATWLSPIFTSPMADFGYDIANFKEIDPIFGTSEDFDALIAKANELGLKIILDFVPNHSSDECEWFIKSAARDPEYEDFYVWHPGKEVNGTRHPPNNWLSVFRGSAWTWNEQRQEYYLHQFVDKQPDLNYRNPKVKEAMVDVLKYWLARGVAGFRIDAVPHVFEVPADEEGNWPDEPRNPNVEDPDNYGYLQHIYTVDQPETIELVYEWRKVMDDFQAEHGGDTRVILAETYSPIDIVMKYYGNDTVNGAHIPFNFNLITKIHNSSNAYDYVEWIDLWLTEMPKGRTANWVMGNHDQRRVGSRLGTDRIDMINMLLLTLPGCSITYQGEEIGMTDVWISWEDTVDPQACNSNPQIYESLSRDPARTPFQWNMAKNSGFTTADKTWLPVSPNYPFVNVMKERTVAKSHLNLYKQLQSLRHEYTLKHGQSVIFALNNNVLVVLRTLENNFSYITLMNLNDEFETVDLTRDLRNLPKELEFAALSDHSPHRIGELVASNKIMLFPKESFVLRTQHSYDKINAGYYSYTHA